MLLVHRTAEQQRLRHHVAQTLWIWILDSGSSDAFIHLAFENTPKKDKNTQYVFVFNTEKFQSVRS